MPYYFMKEGVKEIMPNLFMGKLDSRLCKRFNLEGDDWYEAFKLPGRKDDGTPYGYPLRKLNNSEIQFIKEKYNAELKELKSIEMTYWIFKQSKEE